MEMSESVSDLAAALAKAQAAMKGALKESTNPHFKSKYADLANVWDAAHGPLNANGISVVQGASAENAAVSLTTMLLHVSGQWVRSTLTMVARDAGPQSIGSCITYGRRYGLAAMVGIAPEDDDGEGATNHNGNAYQAPAPTNADNPVRGESARSRVAPSGGETSGHHRSAGYGNMPDDGLLRVARVDRTATRKAGMTKYTVTMSTGEQYSTIKDRLGELCQQLMQDGLAVYIGPDDFKETKWGRDLLAIHRAEPGTFAAQLAKAGKIDIPSDPLEDADISPF